MGNLERKENDFLLCNIREMGDFLRHELIKKWYRLGREHTVKEEDLEKLCRKAEQIINTLKGDDGCLPTIPSHILIILQQLDFLQAVKI